MNRLLRTSLLYLGAFLLGAMVLNPSVSAQTQPTVTFSTGGTLTVVPGGTISVPVKVSGFVNVTSAQFTVTWNPAVLRLDGVSSFGVAFLSSGNFNLNLTGALTVSWNPDTGGGITASDGTTFFAMDFTAVGADGTTTSATFSDSPTKKQVTVGRSVAIFDAQDSGSSIRVRAPNTRPTITSISNQTIDEDTSTSPLAFTVADNETPAANLSLGFSSSNQALVPSTGSSFSFGGSGANRTLVVTPLADQSGSTTITVTVSDGSLSSSTNFVLTVNPVNDPPTLSNLPDISTPEDTPVNVNFTVGDLETSTLSLVVTVNGSQLAPDQSSQRTVQLTPGFNQTGDVQITVSVSDGQLTTSKTFKLTILPVNDPPTISGISDQTTDEDTPTGPISFTIGDVDNALGALLVLPSSDNSGLIPAQNISIAGTGANRTVTLTPLPNQNGSAKITLTVFDGTDSTSTSFFLTVRSLNDAPTISAIADQSALDATPTSLIPFTVGDQESNPGSLTVEAISSNSTLAPDGAFEFGGTGANRTLRITPAEAVSGTCIVFVTVSDGSATATSSFTLTVTRRNTPPTISGLGDRVINEDIAGQIDFTVGDGESSAASLQIGVHSSNQSVIPDQNLLLAGTGAGRSLVFSPIANRNGVCVITVSVSDGELVTTRDFQVTVQPVNDPPTISVLSNLTINQGTSGSEQFSIDDIDTAPEQFQVSGVSSNPTLIQNSAITFSGTGNIRTVSVQPNAGQFGAATIEVRVFDGVSTVTSSFLLTVQSVNLPPSFGNFPTTYNVDEDTVGFTIPFVVSDPDTALDRLAISASSSNLKLLPDSGIRVLDNDAGGKSLGFTFANGESGTSFVTLRVGDGTTEITKRLEIVVLNVNDPPVIDGLEVVPVQISEDESVNYNLRFADDSPLSDITVSFVSGDPELFPENRISIAGVGLSRTVVIRPAQDRHGSGFVDLIVGDGQSQTTQRLTIVVRPVNDDPLISSIPDQAINEDTTLRVSFQSRDVDNPFSDLFFSTATTDQTLAPLSGISVEGIGPDYTLVVKPATNRGGSARITVSVTDGIAESSTSFGLTVRDVNDPPTITPIEDLSMVQNTTSGPVAFRIADLETPAELLKLSLAVSDPVLLPDGAILGQGTGADRSFRVTPARNRTGQAFVTFTVGDGSLESSSRFLVTVKSSENEPVISRIDNQTTLEDTATAPIEFTITDPDTPVSLLQVTGASTNPTLVPDSNIVITGLNESRRVVVTPAPDQSGSATIIISVDDGTSSGQRSFALVVAPVNDAPRMSQIADQTIGINSSTGPIPFTLTDPETASDSMVLTRASSDEFLVPLSGITIGGNGANRTVTVIPETDQAGTATITLQASDGSLGTTTSFQVTILPGQSAPRITRNLVGQTVLAGTTARLTVEAVGSRPLNYRWRFKDDDLPGQTGPELVLPAVTTANAGDYEVVVSNSQGEARDAARLTVNAPASITQQPAPATVPVGSPASFQVVAVGTEPLQYQWQLHGQDLPGKTGPTLSIPSVGPADEGPYTVLVSNVGGSVSSQAALLRAVTKPSIQVQPNGVEVATGANVEFTVVASGTDPLKYQWSRNGTDIAGANGPSLSRPNAQTADAGTYQVLVSNEAGSAPSAEAVLRVSQLPGITTPPANLTVVRGSPAQFSVQPSGSAPFTYQWLFNGVELPGQVQQALSIPSAQPENGGKYSVRVRNGVGQAESAEAVLTVILPVTFAAQPQGGTVARDSSFTFEALVKGTEPFTYQWRFKSADIPGATGPTHTIPKLALTDTGDYQVVARNAAGPVTSEVASLLVRIPPGISAQPVDAETALNGSVTFSVGASGDGPLAFQWLKNGANIPGATGPTYTIPNVQVTDAGNYSVVVVNNVGAVTSDPATLTVKLPALALADNFADAPIYSKTGVFDGGGNDLATVETDEPDHAGQQGGKSLWFIWKSPSGGVVRIQTTGSNFDTLLAVYLGSILKTATVVAANDDYPGGFSNSRVEFNASPNTEYRVAIDGFGGAAGRIVASISSDETAAPLPEISSHPTPEVQTVPAGSDVAYSVSAVGPNLTYQWLLNGDALFGQTSQSLVLKNVQKQDAGSYSVRVTRTAGPVSSSLDSHSAILEIGEGTAQDKFFNAPSLEGETGPVPTRIHAKPILDGSGSVARGYSGAQVFSTFGASKEQGEPNHCGVVGGASQWFTYQAPANGVLRVSTEGSNFDTILAVYTGPGTDFESLQAEGCDNDSGPGGKDSVVFVPVTAGTVYFIVVDGVKGVTGSVQLGYQLAQAPVIVKEPISQSVLPGGQATLTVGVTNLLAAVTTNTPATTFQWSKDGSILAGQVNASLVLNNAQTATAGDYRVVASNFAGSATSAVSRVSLSVPLSFTTQPQAQAVRVGASAVFIASASGTSPLTYQWRLNGADIAGATESTLNLNNVQKAAAGNYTLVVRNPVGQVVSASAALGVFEPMTVLPLPEVTPVQAGSATELNVVVAGPGPFGYQWRKNGLNLAGATASKLTLNNVRVEDGGDYSVLVTNAVEAVVSTVTALQVDVPVNITATPVSKSAIQGSSATFSVKAVGTGPLLYQWLINGRAVKGATNETIVLPSVQPVDSGNYSVQVNNLRNSQVSAPATLTVNVPPQITLQPTGATIFEGTDVTLTADATGTPPLTLQWQLDGVDVPGANGRTLVLTDVRASQGGNYWLVATSPVGRAASSSALLNVQQVLSAAQVQNNTFHFQLTIPPGKKGVLQVSSDLVNWADFLPSTFTGSADISDNQAGATARRYFRLEFR